MSREKELEDENTKLKTVINNQLAVLKNDIAEIKQLLLNVNEYTKQGSWFQSPSDKMQEAMDKLNDNLKHLRGDKFGETVGSLQQSVKSIEDVIKDS